MTSSSEAKEFLARHFGPLDEGMTVEVHGEGAVTNRRLGLI